MNMASQGPSPHSQPGSQTPVPGPMLGASPAAGSMGSVAGPPPQTQAAHQPPQQPTQSQLDTDPMSRVKALVPHLKDSLSTLMKVAALAFHHSALIDNASQKASDTPAQRFDKSLEEFYSVCDQVELHLRLAQDCYSQQLDGMRLTPIPLATIKSDPTTAADSQTYGQYVATVKTQINFARDIHDALMECSNKLGESKT